MDKDEFLVGVDLTQLGKQIAKQLEADLPNEERRRNKAEREHQYSQNKTFHILVTPTAQGYRAETIDHPFAVGRLEATGFSVQKAIAELRFAFAQALVDKQLLSDLTEARAYCAGVTFPITSESTLILTK